MENYRYLLDIALILLATKAFGLFTRRLQMPSVVGSLLAGIILGPALLNIVQPSDLISSLSEIGVIVLMFEAGLDTSITNLKNAGLKALWIALLGVLVPLAMGFLVGSMYNVGPEAWLENLFIGVILTATSVGITVETLKEMGAMKTHSGNTILAAAVIDDVLGIVALTLVSGMADSSINIGIVLLKVVLFFIFSIIVGIILHKVFAFWFDHDSRGGLQRYSIVSFAFALIMAFVSEEFFGVADITGSFVAGLMISGTSQCAYVTKRISTLSYLLITPIFFANIGLGLTGIEFNGGTLLLILIFCVVAVLSKVLGCAVAAKMVGYSNSQSMRIGCGMVSRGEVALIVANRGIALGLLSSVFVTPILLCVVFTTVVTPLLLKWAYKPIKNDPDFLIQQAK